MPDEDVKRDAEGRTYEYLAVTSEANAFGAYVCTLRFGEQLVRVLPRDEALAYVTEVAWVVACAEFDAAVYGQLTAAKMQLPLIMLTVRHLRNDRRPVLAAATSPVTFEPIVSNSDKVGRVHAQWGEISWSWELEVARQHIGQVLEVTGGVDLDTAYFTHLHGVVGLEEEESRHYVALLRNFMPGLVDTSK